MYRIMIVEDEVLVRVGLRNSIEWAALDMEVVAAVGDGQQAWDLYREDKPDLILTDIRMPIMDGMQLIRQIRAEDEETRIVILSCMEEFDLVREAISLGVTDYILKLTMTPEQMTAVLRKVKEQLDSQRQQTAVQEQEQQLGGTASLKAQVWLEQLLKDYMFRQLYNVEEFERQLRQAGVALADQQLVVLLIEVDHFEKLRERFNDEKGDLIKSSLINVFREVLQLSQTEGLCIHLDPLRYLMVASYREVRSAHALHQRVAALAAHVQQVMRTFFNVTVTLGASTVRSGFPQLTKQYAEAQEALSHKYVLGGNRIVRAGETSREQLEGCVGPVLQQLAAYGSRFGGGTFGKLWEEKLAPFVNEHRGASEQSSERSLEGRPARAGLQALLAQLLQLPFVHFALRDAAAHELAQAGQEALVAAETFAEAAQALAQTLDQLLTLSSASSSYSKAVSEAVAYIHTNYVRDLSHSEVAEHVAMSPNYFGTLFRKETGMSVIDYIHHCRIRKAKSLLLETPLKTYEIAEQVGFADHSYFSRVFRKETGFNPTDYRRREAALRLKELRT